MLLEKALLLWTYRAWFSLARSMSQPWPLVATAVNSTTTTNCIAVVRSTNRLNTIPTLWWLLLLLLSTPWLLVSPCNYLHYPQG
jgi:hypothetical protein